MPPSATFWDKIAEKYAKQPISDDAAYQKKLEVTRGYLRPDMEVLELGCGTGSTALIHAPFVNHIRATDISRNMLTIGKRKAEAAGITNITFEQATVEDLNLAENSIDMVMAHSLLHLLEDKETAMTKIFKALKPGGAFVSSTVCLRDRMWFLAPLLPIMRFFGFAPMVKVFSSADLINAMEQVGFAVDHQWLPPKGSSIFVVALKSKKAP